MFDQLVIYEYNGWKTENIFGNMFTQTYRTGHRLSIKVGYSVKSGGNNQGQSSPNNCSN